MTAPADFLDARTDGDRRGFPSQPGSGGSRPNRIPRPQAAAVGSIRSTSAGRPARPGGRPLIARGARYQRILERTARLSQRRHQLAIDGDSATICRLDHLDRVAAIVGNAVGEKPIEARRDARGSQTDSRRGGAGRAVHRQRRQPRKHLSQPTDQDHRALCGGADVMARLVADRLSLAQPAGRDRKPSAAPRLPSAPRQYHRRSDGYREDARLTGGHTAPAVYRISTTIDPAAAPIAIATARSCSSSTRRCPPNP